MKPETNKDIDALLLQMRRDTPQHHDRTAFEEIMKKAGTRNYDTGVGFVQMRNAGIAILLILAVNIFVVIRPGDSDTASQPSKNTSTYLQPFNLNLY